MKKHFLLGLIFAITLTKVYGQTSPSLFVVIADEKILLTDPNGVSMEPADANATHLVYIDLSLIGSVTMLKGQDATERFGSRAHGGAIVLMLTTGAFGKLREIDREKFK